MTIIHQLKAIKQVALKNLYKKPEYFQMLIDEINLKLLDIENEKLGHIEGLELTYASTEPFDLREVGVGSKNRMRNNEF